ncbi:MAG: hypothetical protein AAB116_09195 [Candidatus Poribacteria bacterium]
MRNIKYILTLFVFLTVILSVGSFNYGYAQGWIDGTPLFHDDAMSILKAVGRNPRPTLAPPANINPAFQVGDLKKFYALNIPNNKQYTLDSSCLEVSDKAYIFVEKGTEIAQDRLNSLAESFAKIYDEETKQFGPPPNTVSNDPRVYLLILDIIDGARPNGVMLLGYFSPVDQYRNADIPQWARQKSNEANMLYIDSASLNAKNINIDSVVAHEFSHLIQWARDPEESTWINEGLAVYTENMFGYNVQDRISAFVNNPTVSLRIWGDKVENYGAAYLFLTYISERFGGLATITDIFKNELEDIAGIEGALSNHGIKDSFRDIFTDWVIANYLDDTNLADGRYGYSTVDVHLKSSTVETQYPIVQKSSSELPWSARYIEFNKAEENTLTLTISESDNLIDINAGLINFNNNGQINVSSVKSLDSQSGSASVPKDNSRAVLVVSSQPNPPDQNRNSSFLYSAEAKAVSVAVTTSGRDITTWGKIKKD